MEPSLNARRRPALIAVLALAGALLCAGPRLAHAQEVVPPSGGPYLYDALGQFTAITTRPEAMGWFPSPDGEGPDPTMCKHWQGVARSQGPGPQYLFVSRSGNNTAACPFAGDTVTGHDVSGDLSVVRLDSREPTGERWRSNRLRRDTDIVDTAPPGTDRRVTLIRFDGSAIAGDEGTWPDYYHPGGMQLVGDVLVVPLEAPSGPGMPANLIAFLDVADPEQPTLISTFDPGVAPESFEWSAGLVAVTRLPDGRYLMLLTGGQNDVLKLFTSSLSPAGLRDPGLAWSAPAFVTAGQLEEQLGQDWPENGPPFGDAHQMLSFVREGPGDDQLYLIGARNSNSGAPLAEDHLDLYRVGLVGGFSLDKIGDRHLDTHATTTDGTAGSGNIANLAAGSGIHVTPSGELLVYATEHDNTGPSGSANFGEWRNRRVVRDDSPTLDPSAHPGGPYTVPEGGTVALHGHGDLPTTAAWMELFTDPGFSDRSAMVDHHDWARESYDDFDQLDGESSDPDNFSDDPSSVRWFAPVGCTLRLNDDDFADEDFPGDNVRTLPGQGVVVEGAFEDLANVSNDAGDDDMDGSITSVEFRPDCDAYYSAAMGVEWDLDGDGGFETSGPDVDFSAATLDGPFTASVAMRAVHPSDLRAGNATATVGVTNVAPAISTVQALDPTGAQIGSDIPVALVGLPVTVEVSFTDPGVADTQTAAIDWDDGTVDPSTAFDAFSDAHGGGVGTVSHAHRSTAPGTFTIEVSVTDDDGGATSAAVVVEVLSPQDALELVLDDLDARLPTATGAARRALLAARDAIDGHVLGAASDGALDHLDSGQLDAAMRKLGAAIDGLLATEAAGAGDLGLAKDLVGLAAFAIAADTHDRAVDATAPPSPAQQRRLDGIAARLAGAGQSLAADDHEPAVAGFADAVRGAMPLCGC